MTVAEIQSPDFKYIQIDEDGFLMSDGARIDDEEWGSQVLSALYYDEFGRLRARSTDVEIIVEAFNQPYVAQQIERVESERGEILLPYGVTRLFLLSTLQVDEWDRFHGITDDQIPFVLSRQAQNELFNLATEYDDDSLTFGNHRIETEPFQSILSQSSHMNHKNLHSSLLQLWPRLKKTRSKILVLNADLGNEAEYLAEHGHIVTAVVSHSGNLHDKKDTTSLRWKAASREELDQKSLGLFDVIFDKISFKNLLFPERKQYVKKLKHLLQPSGEIFIIFFVSSSQNENVYTTSEWEVRERLANDFDFFYWNRWRTSRPEQLGKELSVYAKRKS